MAETVIYPLSEETGLRILDALNRIATALEGGEPSLSASVDGTDLSLDGGAVSVVGTDLRITSGAVSVDGTELKLP